MSENSHEDIALSALDAVAAYINADGVRPPSFDLPLEAAVRADPVAACFGVAVLAAELIVELRRQVPERAWSIFDLLELTEGVPPKFHAGEVELTVAVAYANAVARNLQVPPADFELAGGSGRLMTWILAYFCCGAVQPIDYSDLCEPVAAIAEASRRARLRLPQADGCVSGTEAHR